MRVTCERDNAIACIVDDYVVIGYGMVEFIYVGFPCYFLAML